MPFEIQADTIENLWVKFIKIRHVYRGRRLDLQYCSQVLVLPHCEICKNYEKKILRYIDLLVVFCS